ncbi:dihydroneopterin aldolase [Sphingomonas lacusdianchii]|uniref:dihydroneopterin aldolase n=1 Tax=Sphingomonas lacusdianchii TaxID=2917992 RepID=UPI001F56FA4E
MRYVIRLKNCSFFAHHGVFDEEGTLGQRFHIDAEVQVDATMARDGRAIVGTVDYGEMFAEIERVVRGRRRLLIEALALEIARGLCERFASVVQARITLRKPSVPIHGILDHVEVEVTWPMAGGTADAAAGVSRSAVGDDAIVLLTPDRL